MLARLGLLEPLGARLGGRVEWSRPPWRLVKTKEFMSGKKAALVLEELTVSTDTTVTSSQETRDFQIHTTAHSTKTPGRVQAGDTPRGTGSGSSS